MMLKNEFLAYLDQLPVFDGHEHLDYPTSSQRGFFDILQYAKSDLLSAGMPKDSTEFGAFYKKTANTAYFHGVRRYAKDLYGVESFDEQSVLRLDGMIKERSRDSENWARIVLRDKCHIDCALTMHDGSETKHEIIKPALYLDFLLRREQIHFLSKRRGHPASFSEYLAYMDSWLDRQFAFGAVAGKFGTPYWRDMDFLDATEDMAQREFELDQMRSPCLEGFLFHRILARFENEGVAIQFHTGHVEPQSANMKDYQTQWSDPAPFGRIALRFPQLKMILLHTGFPYSEGYFSLIKNVPNLYADFSWIYLISPMLAERNLHLALETVPISKIIGFGGDAQSVELVYGHLKMAKEVIARVFADRVGSGWLNRNEAEEMMALILHDNGHEIYGIK